MPPRRVVVLCDNVSSDPTCGCEWGLSLAIETGDGGLWLWDTGQTSLFLKNAAALGVDVGAARGLALSHGHYDHTGGLSALLEAGFTGVIHAHPACASERWAKDKGKPRRIAPPDPLPAFSPVGRVSRLAPGLTMLADIPRAPGRFQAVQGFSFDPQGRKPDAVPDDAFLVLDTDKGPVVILGCCHSGLANSLACAEERLGLRFFHTVLGGLHLFQAGPEALEDTACAITQYGVRHLVAGHCTGTDRVESLRSLLPGCRVDHLTAGMTLLY